jgi:hypothetical protein
MPTQRPASSAPALQITLPAHLHQRLSRIARNQGASLESCLYAALDDYLQFYETLHHDLENHTPDKRHALQQFLSLASS